MAVLSELRVLNREQRHTVLASFLGWTLDAFDFFLLVFVVSDGGAGLGRQHHKGDIRHPPGPGGAALWGTVVRSSG